MTRGELKEIDCGPIGRIRIAATGRGVCRLTFGGTKSALLASLPRSIEWSDGARLMASALRELAAYAKGERTKFTAKLDLSSGTPFQQRVWRVISSIPWGETRSYAWLAAKIGKPKACRAVANACGRNPVPIIIPCHRVIASDGSIGGFSCGIGMKRKLIELEGI